MGNNGRKTPVPVLDKFMSPDLAYLHQNFVMWRPIKSLLRKKPVGRPGSLMVFLGASLENKSYIAFDNVQEVRHHLRKDLLACK